MAKQRKAKRRRRTGLASWMEQVLACHRTAQRTPDVQSVHQLRKALRRCRTLAGALREVDPAPEWRDMLKASRALFKALGGLRDTHVLVIWLDRLAPEEDAVGRNLRYRLNQREVELTAAARAALDAFDREAWRESIGPLAASAARHAPGEPLFEQLAMRRLVAAHAQHRRAMKGGSRTAWHDLRKDIKRLRYAVENFLPDLHARWGDELALLQEALGDVHDLDVLWDEFGAAHLLVDGATRDAWRRRLDAVRDARLDAYRERMTGPGAGWKRWRDELLAPDRVERANHAALARWGVHHGCDPERGAWLADGLAAALDGLEHLVPEPPGPSTRRIGVAGAQLHGLAGSPGKPASRKRIDRQLAKLPLPIGWDEATRRACGRVLADMYRPVDANPDEGDGLELPSRLLGLLDALAPVDAPLPNLRIVAAHGLLRFDVAPLAADAAPAGRRLAAALGVPVILNPG
ncbi:MAG: CHAD domain-containing protein [Gammaproteobacteria bacterium]|nr:CHAD domain-containing protein [Gammaproteobacteria bacterium]